MMRIAFVILFVAIVAGCARIPLENHAASDLATQHTRRVLYALQPALRNQEVRQAGQTHLFVNDGGIPSWFTISAKFELPPDAQGRFKFYKLSYEFLNGKTQVTAFSEGIGQKEYVVSTKDLPIPKVEMPKLEGD